MLTERQKKACREYLADCNWFQAMIRAGYSWSTAKCNGYRLFRNPEVKFYLKELMDEQKSVQKLTAERVIEELRRLALSDIRAFYKWNAKKKKFVLKPLDELTTEQAAAIAKYEPGKGYTLYNKEGALDKLAKYFKLYSDIDQTITNYVLMPEMKLNGKPMVFNIGEPAPHKKG